MTHTDFEKNNIKNIHAMKDDPDIHKLTKKWFDLSTKYEYSYHFSWMGRPIIQYPQDILAMQELIWQVKPDLIIETGIAHGGSSDFLRIDAGVDRGFGSGLGYRYRYS